MPVRQYAANTTHLGVAPEDDAEIIPDLPGRKKSTTEHQHNITYIRAPPEENADKKNDSHSLLSPSAFPEPLRFCSEERSGSRARGAARKEGFDSAFRYHEAVSGGGEGKMGGRCRAVTLAAIEAPTSARAATSTACARKDGKTSNTSEPAQAFPARFFNIRGAFSEEFWGRT